MASNTAVSTVARLLVASVDKAREIGIDWWQRDPYLSSRAELPAAERAAVTQ